MTLKLDLTQEQLESLTTLIALGTWMLSHQAEDDDVVNESEIDALDELGQKIFTAAAESGFSIPFSEDDETGDLLPTPEFSEELVEYIEAYNQETFWEGLVASLVGRDVQKKYSPAQMKAMNEDEWRRIYEEYEKKYENEFEENGLERLDIVK